MICHIAVWLQGWWPGLGGYPKLPCPQWQRACELLLAEADVADFSRRWNLRLSMMRSSISGPDAMAKKRRTYEPRVFDGRVIESDEIERIHQEILTFDSTEVISIRCAS